MKREDATKGIKVLLIQPPQGKFVRERIFQPGVEIPLNLLYMASFLRGKGMENRCLDMRVLQHPEEVLLETMRESHPTLVGISACTTEIENAGEVAATIKRVAPDTPVVLGGHHASALPRETLKKYPAIDYIILGEGEYALRELTRRILEDDEIEDVPNLVFRRKGKIQMNEQGPMIQDLDSLPFPCREVLDLEQYVPSPGTGNFMQLPSTGIIGSRGCPYQCRYCSKGVWGRTVRFRSPANIVQEIEHCIGRHGIHDFRFYDDMLTFPKFDIGEFCEIVTRKNLKITWNCYSRVNHITKEKLELMKQAGCYHIKYGIEFGTEKALKVADKKATLEMARTAVKLTKETGIECKGNFILGIPEETREDCVKTIEFAKEISPDLVAFYPFDAFPGTEFYKKYNKDGLEKVTLPRHVTEELASRAYREFYFRPSFILQRAKRIGRNPIREIRLLTNGISMMSKFYAKRRIHSLQNKK